MIYLLFALLKKELYVQRGNTAGINVRQAALCALSLGEAYKLTPQTSY